MKAKGFTLLELLIAMGVVGVLATVAVPIYHSYVGKAEIAKLQKVVGDFRRFHELCKQTNVPPIPNKYRTSATDDNCSSLNPNTFYNSSMVDTSDTITGMRTRTNIKLYYEVSNDIPEIYSADPSYPYAINSKNSNTQTNKVLVYKVALIDRSTGPLKVLFGLTYSESTTYRFANVANNLGRKITSVTPVAGVMRCYVQHKKYKNSCPKGSTVMIGNRLFSEL